MSDIDPGDFPEDLPHLDEDEDRNAPHGANTDEEVTGGPFDE